MALFVGGARRLDLGFERHARPLEGDRIAVLLTQIGRPFYEAYRERYEVPSGVAVAVVTGGEAP